MIICMTILEPDPKDHYKDKMRCIEMAGYLPMFTHGDKPTLAENMEDNYQYFMGWSQDTLASVEDGMFLYPGDRPLVPVLKMHVGGPEAIYVYPHAIVAVVVDDVLTKWARFD